MPNEHHWTSQNLGSLTHRIGFDFILQVEKKLEADNISQSDLAKTLGVSEGAVSKVLNNPQNLTVKTIAKYSRALGIKASIVAYDDGDHTGALGPISSEVFADCWSIAGRPRDFWEMQAVRTKLSASTTVHWSSLTVTHFGHPIAALSGYGTFIGGMPAGNNTILPLIPGQLLTGGTNARKY
jgi:transcriptional regulator with XRE-family HTH domain